MFGKAPLECYNSPTALPVTARRLTRMAASSPISRPPVVAVMGHIDHGKSSLLDYIRKSKVVESEAGGITQHLSAYEVEHESEGEKRKITFIDTPGHEAFQKMRSRGSAVADVAVLVVSSEDGVKPQTLEAWHAIVGANIPFVVAITKIDKPNANVERAKSSLLEHGIYLEGMGGTISYVPISSKTGDGIPELLDVVLLAADLAELTGTTDAPAEGVVIESHRDPKKGVSATIIIKNGTLSSGDFGSAGVAITPTRLMTDFRGKTLKSATFSQPITISGFSDLPPVGAFFTGHSEKNSAEEAASLYASERGALEHTSDENEKAITVALVIKADVSGSLEAIEHELMKRQSDDVTVRIVHKGVGGITEGDLKFATGAAHTAVLGFNVSADTAATEWSRRLNVPIASFSIIYKFGEWVDEHIAKMRAEAEKTAPLGKAAVLKVFSVSKQGQLVGAKVVSGVFKRNYQCALVREGTIVGKGRIDSLKQQKADVDEIPEGKEFGTLMDMKMEIQAGDEMWCLPHTQ